MKEGKSSKVTNICFLELLPVNIARWANFRCYLKILRRLVINARRDNIPDGKRSEKKRSK